MFTNSNDCAVDVRTAFLLNAVRNPMIPDLNCHNQESLGSTKTYRACVAALDYATVSGCVQLVIGPTHARG